MRYANYLPNREAVYLKVTQSCLTLCDPMDCSLPSSSVHGILQARVPEWVSIAFSRGFSWTRSPALQADFLPTEPLGKPLKFLYLSYYVYLLCFAPSPARKVDKIGRYGQSPIAPTPLYLLFQPVFIHFFLPHLGLYLHSVLQLQSSIGFLQCFYQCLLPILLS